MAQATQTQEMGVPKEKLWDVITDYEKYPEFVEGARKVRVLSKSKGVTRVEYSIQMMGKEVFYVLDHKESKKAEEMSWSLVESNVLKSNEGRWVLKSNGKTTEATYELSLEFKLPVPGLVLRGLVKSSLPRMLSQFESRAKKV